MNKNVVWPIFLIVAFTVFAYRDIFNVFYQQDEWQTIGNNIVLNNFLEVFSNFSFLNFISVQERFASNALAYFLMSKYAFSTVWIMGAYSLFFHIVNSLLAYYIVRKWVIKDAFFSVVAALFFAVSSVSVSAVSWFGTSLGTLPAVTLVLLSLILYFKYLEKPRIKWLILTLTTLYLSFFFKEIGIFLLIYLPLISLIFKKYKLKSFIKTFWAFFAVFLTTTVFRLINIVFLSDRSGELFVTSSEKDFIQLIVVRIFMYPITSFSLAFVPPELAVSFAKYFTNTYYPFVPSEHFNLIAQTIVIDIFAVSLTLLILVAIYILAKSAPVHTKKIVIFWVLFFFLSFLPYILLSKSFAYLESRYYYLAGLPAGILLGFLGLSSSKFLSKWRLGVLPTVFAVLFLAVHLNFLSQDLKQLKSLSDERIEFFNQLKGLKPVLNKNKNIFLLTGDHDYYISGNKVPFQQGMGYTLMVFYYQTGYVPGELIKDRFLWNLNTQGYSESGDLGFGFFTNEEEMKKAIRGSDIDNVLITSLYYDSRAKKLLLD